MAAPARARAGVGKGLLLLAASVALSLLAGEALARLLRPRPYDPVVFLTPDGNQVPISEIAHFLRHAPNPDRAERGPRAWSPAHLDVLLRYDRPRWSYFDANGCIRVTHNRYGFRDQDFPVEKPAGELRALALGDSFTYGSGVPLEDSWPQVLEALIEERRPAEVINAGFASGAPWPSAYPKWVEAEGLHFQPDLVLVGLCLNDLSVGVPMLAYPVAPDDQFQGPSELVSRLRRHLARKEAMAAERDYTSVVESDPMQWRETQDGLIALRDLLAAHDVDLVVAVLPMLSGLRGDYPYLGLHALAAEFCRAQGIACVDLLPAVRGRADEDLWVHPTDQHPNDVCCRLFAEGLHAFLDREGFLR